MRFIPVSLCQLQSGVWFFFAPSSALEVDSSSLVTFEQRTRVNRLEMCPGKPNL